MATSPFVDDLGAGDAEALRDLVRTHQVLRRHLPRTHARSLSLPTTGVADVRTQV